MPTGLRKKELEVTPSGAAYSVVGKNVPDSSEVKVTASTQEAKAEVSFVILGPGEAKGFPAGQNVPKCPNCQARQEACICPEA